MDDARFENVEDLLFGADIDWNITKLTTLGIHAERKIEPTTLFGASGIKVTNWGITIDHELLRHAILNADINLTRDSYQDLDRSDDVFSISIGMKFMLSRNLYALIGYGYERRKVESEELTNDDYRIENAFIQLQTQL